MKQHLMILSVNVILNSTEGDPYGQAASSLVAGSTLDGTVESILEMGGGAWDRDTVVRALRAAFNNPERAVEYLYTVRNTVLLFNCSFVFYLLGLSGSVFCLWSLEQVLIMISKFTPEVLVCSKRYYMSVV
jgi:hypothetical protein